MHGPFSLHPFSLQSKRRSPDAVLFPHLREAHGLFPQARKTLALLLSAVGKTGPILWSMSGPANQLLRQLGLLLFLAEVGTSAGKNLVATFQESGLLLFGVGATITVVPMLVAVVVGRLVFKISLLDLLGTITGGMTSTPGLAAADSMVDSNIPSVAYATVYPIAMVFLILFIHCLRRFGETPVPFSWCASSEILAFS